MDRKQLIKKYIEFFKGKNHKEIVNASLVPENDPTVLFTTAGMHPLVPYLLGQKHPLGKRLVNVQKCIRTGDIDEVGDSMHHTFFEMLGNWSLGDYWKKEAIEYSFEFLTKVLGLRVERIGVSCFKGDKDAEKDNESANVWEGLGIASEKIVFLGKKDNWWGPAGKTGPCGPDTEMFYYQGKNVPKRLDVEDKNWVEIWNDVFMEYDKDKRLILVDGMYCLYDENFKINKELIEIVNSLNTHTVLAVNGFREKGRDLIKNYDKTRDTNWEAFSLEEREIKKDNPEYFKILLRQFNLVPEEVIYFDHDKKNVETARKLGIISKQYTGVKSIKQFIKENLWAFIPLKQKNVDTGMGIERTIAVLNGFDDDYLTDCFLPIIKKIEKLSGKSYNGNEREIRIIADHIKASVFIIADGVVPSNVERGYVLRRLIRRAIRYGRQLGMKGFVEKVAESVFEIYDDYDVLKDKARILKELVKEEERFLETLERGMRVFEKVVKKGKVLGKDAFLLYQSYGFPIEMTIELANEKKIKVDEKGFEKESEKHQSLSRTATEGKFKSGLADKSEETTKLHTVTHLLAEALRQVLGKEIVQKGSNITAERLRFDFSFDRKLTDEEKKKVEDLVNGAIEKDLEVKKEEMSVSEAKKIGAQGVFERKYGSLVSVYSIGDFSKEICAGPHVSRVGGLGRFRIVKEESSSAGVRRVKGVLE